MILSQEEEKIIRHEAGKFYTSNIQRPAFVAVSPTVAHLREKLQGYYYENMRAIFLNTLKKLVDDFLQTAPDHHAAVDGCKVLNLYIRQEISILPTILHSKEVSNKMRTKAFISYSHADDEDFKELQVHFAPHKNRIEVWSDKNIKVGEKWKEQIEKALSETKVAIFLVSPNFFASDFIMSEELPTLLKASENEGVTVLSVILKPIPQASFKLSGLDIYQAMNAPEKPLSDMNETEKGQIYANIVDQVIKILNQN